MAQPRPGFRRPSTRPPTTRPDRLHLGHHRQAEGDDALPPRRAGDLRRLSARTCCSAEPDDIFIGTPPLAFTFGLGGLVLFPLRVGASTVLLEQAAPGRAARRRSRAPRHGLLHRADRLSRDARQARRARRASPAQVRLGRRGAAARDLRGLAATRPGIEIIDGIGATEMLHIFIAAPRGRDPPRRDRQGGAGLRGEGRRRRRARRAARHVGRLAVRGPTGCRYLADDAAARLCRRTAGTSPATPTCMDEDGYFCYQARTDDMIISAGYNIAGPEVEASAAGPSGRRRVRRRRRAGRGARQIVKAYVVLRDPGHRLPRRWSGVCRSS